MAESTRGGGLIRAGAAILLALGAAAAAAPLLTAHAPDEQLDTLGGRYLPPGSRAQLLRFDNGRRWLVTDVDVDADTVTARRGGLRVEADRSAIVNLGEDQALDAHFFPLGTDRLGRDCWSRILHAGRVSLSVGVAAALLSGLLGLAIGTLAGASRGWIDALLMRITDAFMAFPRLFLVLAVTALLDAGPLAVVLVLGCTGWMGVARLIRAEVLKISRADFVAAARSGGSSEPAIALRHLARNAMTPLITSTALRVGNVILIEAALSYLGLGIQPPTPTWGNMIHDGWTDLTTAWWASVFPGLAIVCTVVSLNLLGDGLRERLQPRPARG